MKYFIYCRKSSEDKDRQVLSILSQEREVERRFGEQTDIEIVGRFQEEKSAMKPERPVFDAMIGRIELGEAQGIIAWAPDRLARNSIDGGRMIYLLDRGVLRDLKFATYTFENNSQGKFMLQIMFGQSKYYSDALSENVRRGIRTKLENGWLPNQAPIGYLNDRATSTIVIDPARFPLVKRMFDMLLTGAYSAEQIREAAESWGLTTLQRKRLGGKPLSLSGVYRVFSNPFYTGVIPWKGEWHSGKHVSMITLAEFERVREILGRPGRPQPQLHLFAYSGLIRCGSCGLMVTAEKHTNRFGSHYTYYHCTKRLRPRCTEPYVEVRHLETQIRAFLAILSIPDSITAWASQQIEAERSENRRATSVTLASIERAIDDSERYLSELTDLRARRLVDDDEFLEKREGTRRRLLQLRQSLAQQAQRDAHWFEPVRTIISFNKHAVSWFEQGTDEERRLIVHAVGSNLSLSNRILSIEARKVFRYAPREPDLPSLRGVVENIRKLADNGDLEEPLTYIQKLTKLRAARLSNSGDLPDVPMSEAA